MIEPNGEPHRGFGFAGALTSLGATALGFVLPSRTSAANLFKIVATSIALAALFLFTSRYFVPGGAGHFILWARAITDGSTLAPTIAQRDVGFPLLLLLSGYTLTGSFIGITVIQAAFAVLMPALLFIALRPHSLGVAYYAGQSGNICLGPFIFMKTIHHDQTYIFFMMLMIVWLIVFFNSGAYRYLYLFTLACLAASISRPAGNLLFPVFLALAFAFASRPRRLGHYAVCALIFAGASALYQWHRYEIFDFGSQASVPSYVGQQVFYNLYINSEEFGVTLGPEIGPNMREANDALSRALTAAPRDAKFVQDHAAGMPKAFAEAQLLPFTRDELMRRVYRLPNWEYYLLFCDAEPNDQVLLKASAEIAQAYPLYVLRYSLRNMMVFFFHPGYSHPRFDVNPFRPIGRDYYPVSGKVYTTEHIAELAVREAQLDILPREPWLARAVLSRASYAANHLWDDHYQAFVTATAFLIVVAWCASAWTAVCACGRWSRGNAVCALAALWSGAKFIAALLSASLLLLYNVAVTAIFAEPDYRYHDFLLLLRVLVAAFGAIVLVRLVGGARGGPAEPIGRGVAAVHAHDAVAAWVDAYPRAASLFLMAEAAALFAGWGWFMHAQTG